MTTLTSFDFAQQLQISEREWLLVADILATHLGDRTVWAFGSRATGRHLKHFSDLDLAVAGRLTFSQRAALTEAFDDALINFKVDIVEMDLADADFLRRIQPDLLLLQPGVHLPSKTA